MAKRYPPEVFPDKFARVHKAYSLLSNSEAGKDQRVR